MMTGTWSLTDKKGKQRGILSIYILHTLKEKPKSGYEILMEIKEKTEDTWTPSKGTIYPLLKQLKDEGLIKIKEQGKRGKNIFTITSEGKKILNNLRKQGKDWREKFLQFRKLFSEILGEKTVNIINLITEISEIAFSLPEEKKEETLGILDRCLIDLKKLNNKA
ncbi:MAG: PadR family transcriptional regulator [Thermoplasmata archaeon]|nr:MAG: PadR family transcriptional regulator [Thermoplasmata archaeon]HEC89809.1 PadR family transcriptional regulator [Thermoplasmatales archaeon]